MREKVHTVALWIPGCPKVLEVIPSDDLLPRDHWLLTFDEGDGVQIAFLSVKKQKVNPLRFRIRRASV